MNRKDCIAIEVVAGLTLIVTAGLSTIFGWFPLNYSNVLLILEGELEPSDLPFFHLPVP